MLHRHAGAFGDMELKASVIEEKNRLDDTGAINLEKVSESIGYSLDTDAVQRFDTNAKAVSDMAYGFGIYNAPGDRSAGLAINKLPGHASTKDSLRERLIKNEMDIDDNSFN
jgi:hypothetical protein